jgi:hypothetical protein
MMNSALKSRAAERGRPSGRRSDQSCQCRTHRVVESVSAAVPCGISRVAAATITISSIRPANIPITGTLVICRARSRLLRDACRVSAPGVWQISSSRRLPSPAKRSGWAFCAANSSHFCGVRKRQRCNRNNPSRGNAR